MAITARKTAHTESNFEILPEGMYTGVCVSVVELGTTDVNVKGDVKEKHKILFEFEVIGEVITLGNGETRPRTINEEFNSSMFKNSKTGTRSPLRARIDGWLGKSLSEDEGDAFDFTTLIGKAGLMQVIHTEPTEDGKQYANINTLLPLMAGMPQPQPTKKLVVFELSPFSQTAFDSLPKWWQDKIKKSKEYLALANVPQTATFTPNTTGTGTAAPQHITPANTTGAAPQPQATSEMPPAPPLDEAVSPLPWETEDPLGEEKFNG